MNLVDTSIGVVLGSELGNYLDTTIRSLLWYPVDLVVGTKIGMLMEPLLGNCLGRSLESFLVLPL